MFKHGFVTLGVLILLCCPQIGESQKTKALGGKAQQTIVETTPGRFRRGWAVKGNGNERTFIDISGEKIDLPTNATYYKISDFEKEFTKMQRDVRDKEGDRTSEYAKLFDWGRNHQLYEAVEQLAEKILKRNPANPNPEAQLAKEWAYQQIETMRKTMGTGVETEEFSMADVQKIRFALLSPDAFGGANPQIAFKRNALKRFLDEMQEAGQYQTREEQREFLKLSPLEQALIIKKRSANKYQPDINIGRDPRLIMDFKTRIQPILSRSCAQPNCHGGEVSKLRLTAKSTSLPQTYYNYYALDTFRSAQGNVIDHAQPETDSLLINFLLPPNLAPKKLTHTPAFPPVIKTKEDPRYKSLIQWLSDQPTYAIDQLMSEKGVPVEEDEQISTDVPAIESKTVEP
ncbi:MAG: hypothetical protein GX629_09235 [Phycisphaerae bacterium]|jgi:hypothetical protein|nr:hypothetical protein [Phycisphaerae bacterium]